MIHWTATLMEMRDINRMTSGNLAFANYSPKNCPGREDGGVAQQLGEHIHSKEQYH
jgi:hypothetical protein